MLPASLLFATSQALDTVTTILGMRAGYTEVNPIGQALLSHGELWIAVAKLLLTAGVLYGAARYVKPRHQSPLLVLLTGITLIAVLANGAQLYTG